MTEQTSIDQLTGENPEYDAFVEKFKPKKTTDDCYTPDSIYDAVCGWVEKEYNLDRSCFVRPFWPGGDYERFSYPSGCVVVDNPPFSILAQIIRFYIGHGIRFFLFAPTLTLFTGKAPGVCHIPCACAVTYANGANVNTSFVTNMDKYIVRTAPELFRVVEEANDRNLKPMHETLLKYAYPDHVITAAIVGRWCKYGVDFRLLAKDCEKISALDSQRQWGKRIFGGGYLLSERAAAERAAAERAAAERAAAIVWELSDREREIIKKIG